MKILILGTEYTISEASVMDDKYLAECDGYCDKTSKKIVIRAKGDDCQLDDFESYRRKVIRHEIIHAFLFESGLHENFKHEQWGHDETMIDWFAVQFEKLQQAFKEADCL